MSQFVHRLVVDLPKNEKLMTSAIMPSHRWAGTLLRARTSRARTVVRYNDAVHADIHCSVGVLDRLNSLEHDEAITVCAQAHLRKKSELAS